MNGVAEPWYSYTLNLWTLPATLAVTWALMKSLTAGRRWSVGRRRHLLNRLRKIAPGVRHAYVTSLFGEPTWEHTREFKDCKGTKVPLTVRTWPLHRMGYLVTWCDRDCSVALYSLTTTSRWFRPRVVLHRYRIRLGKDRLSAMHRRQEQPLQTHAEVGARRYVYWESYYFGNPGGYRTWYIGVNDNGHRALAPTGLSGDSEPERLAQYRRQATINTVVVEGPGVGLDPAELFNVFEFGPAMDTVRLTQPPYLFVDRRFGHTRDRLSAWTWE
ncbi:ETEC_3214 domain-containing protein [Streptomyces mauvecolor]